MEEIKTVIGSLEFIVGKNKIKILTERDYSKEDSFFIKVLKNDKLEKSKKEYENSSIKTNKRIFSLKKEYMKTYS